MCWVYWIERDSGGVRLLVFFILFFIGLYVKIRTKMLTVE